MDGSIPVEAGRSRRRSFPPKKQKVQPRSLSRAQDGMALEEGGVIAGKNSRGNGPQMASSGIFLAFPSAYLSISAENERLAPQPIYLSLEIPLWCSPVPAPSTDTRADPASARRAAGAARGRVGRAGGPLWCGPSLGAWGLFPTEQPPDYSPRSVGCHSPRWPSDQ